MKRKATTYGITDKLYIELRQESMKLWDEWNEWWREAYAYELKVKTKWERKRNPRHQE